ncbi:MAG: hypothetical protein UX86_C0011G0032 [Candidatus Amesbacteria bacterium GW2011_GWC1_47_15]|uniref:Antitoxin n=2 Tax=Candidatus Amesiibacteriota TaxID=1752730 RepID=A0A0G1S404_9BACT|nr:MAG: hypothetical protein UX86_C0011G0032 [Candidatus Amesbacteria bacterium GW2011_GWC1_47_15]KKU98410.1 MAG: hypothetical protein UY28_C0002G0015 [Candidatus Amesbacteria bacterium GW2011_GWB1_48_13]
MSATSARNNFFELLNKIALGAEVVIVKDNKEVALMIPKTSKINWNDLLRASQKVRGILRDYSFEDNPLRRTGASDFLGQWDKEL